MKAIREVIVMALVCALVMTSSSPAAFAQSSTGTSGVQSQTPPQQSGTQRPLSGQERRAEGEQGEEGGRRPRDPMSAQTFAGLRLRSIGPALTSGRITSLAVDPNNRKSYFVGAASGGVWKTVNSGVTFAPVFDNEGSYSIGTVVLDPKNPLVVWVGTGENNNQRSVGYGDGVYRSEDGGRTWRNMGLKASEHIGRVALDPRDSNVVYVAAQGPLWGPGGDRGLYKTTDGGKTWKKILEISENTGVTDVAIDPANPDTLFAAAYQRRRHVWTLINGGPESGLHKSTDGGATWTRLRGGLPTEDIGRIGIAISPADSKVIYARVEAANRRGGIFRSSDRGATWERRNEYDSTAMYYGQIIPDPRDVDRVYVMGVQIQVSEDGGRTLRNFPGRWKHVDNHTMWIDPTDTEYILVGCDGGLYETFDRGANWNFKTNLPITQFYDVAVDNATPFYNVYGGTQDNFSLGGPARTRNISGITNADWFVTNGGDGFQSRVDPKDPNIIYAESQEGGLVRFDRRSGERMGIQPKPEKGEYNLRWNWDSPLLISPHLHTRLYFAANKLFRSDDRGDSWRAISGDLTRQIDRNKLPVMGRVWSIDAVARGNSTTLYGNSTTIAESPKKEGLLYVGTDDGLINITENGGGSWRRVETFPGVPEKTYVSRIVASQHDVNTVYASFDNHKMSDFQPYLLKSTDSGKTWTSIRGDLPERGSIYGLAEDHVNPNLLFVGTEFGLYFTLNGGQKWIRLRGGMPTIAVRDIAIQQRENDLVAATFGRGFYVLDNYSLLQTLKPEMLQQEGVLFPLKSALMYIQAQPLGGRGKGMQGESFYTADNPRLGATITYYLKDALRTKRQQRQDAQRAAERRGEAPPWPTVEQLREEEAEAAPVVIVTITDASGNVVRRMTGPVAAGIHRVSWDLRWPAPALGAPQRPDDDDDDGGFRGTPSGALVMPGDYKVSMAKRVDGKVTQIGSSQSFSVVVDGAASLPAQDRAALMGFQQKVARLQRAMTGALEAVSSLRTRLATIKRALQETPGADAKMWETAEALDRKAGEILLALRGDTTMRQRNEPVRPGISERVNSIAGEQRMSTSRPTQTQMRAYEIAAEEFAAELAKLRPLIENDLAKLEKAMEAIGAPHTPGRIPEWKDKP